MKISLVLITCLLTQLLARAEATKEFPKVDDTSYTEPNGSRVIQLAGDVPAATNEVWQLLTTTEGWKRFAVAFASVDMQVGGIIETSYNPKAQRGDPDNIKNQIVAYIPGRMLTIRCVQAPRNFSHKDEFFATSTTIEIVPIEAKKSHVVLTAVGYRPGEAYDLLYKKFRWGNAYTLEKMRLCFEPNAPATPATSADVLDKVGQRATGGEK